MGCARIKMTGLSIKNGVTKREAMNAWIGGFMGNARKRRKVYRQIGVTKFKFVSGKAKQYRKI